MNLFSDIQNYILFLRQNGYYVSFSDFSDNFHPFTEKFLQHEVHLHSVCSYLKSNPNTIGLCQQNKSKLSKCKIRHCVYSCCYAGVEEYVFPIYNENKRIICVHISGYRDNLKRSVRLKEKTQCLCTPIFEELYQQLSYEKPSQKTVLAFIKPLEYMIKQLYLNCLEDTKTKTPQNAVYLKCLQYINNNFMNDISAGSIAQHLGYSTSYIRAIFKKESGVSLQNKINDIRLENSAFLLKNSSMNVTDIAFNCGFTDSNYFSTIFKKKYGASPLAYRKIENNY